jgi:hypothetical protein
MQLKTLLLGAAAAFAVASFPQMAQADPSIERMVVQVPCTPASVVIAQAFPAAYTDDQTLTAINVDQIAKTAPLDIVTRRDDYFVLKLESIVFTSSPASASDPYPWAADPYPDITAHPRL